MPAHEHPSPLTRMPEPGSASCVLAFMLALVCAQTTFAQSPRALSLHPPKKLLQFSHEIWQGEQGLPQNVVQAVTQPVGWHMRNGTLLFPTVRGVAAFSFQVEPFFYQTKWFYLLCFAALLVAAWAGLRFRERYLRERAHELALLVEERTRALQQEIEERKRAEATLRAASDVLEMRVQERTAALQESEAKLHTVIERVPDAIVMIARGKIIYTNSALTEKLGVSQAEIIGQSPLAFMHKEDHARATAETEALARNGVERAMEYRLVGKAGMIIYIEAYSRVIQYGGARVLLGVLRDITERKQTELALQESEARFRQFAETIQEVFWMTDPAKNQMLYVSPAYEKVAGRTAASLYANPRDWLEAIHPEDRARVLQAALTKQILGEYDETYRIQHLDGTQRWLRDRAFPVRNAQGEVYRIVGIAEDVTTTKLAQEQLGKLKSFYETVIDQLPLQIAILDGEGRYLYINASSVKNPEVRQWMIGKTVLDYCRYRNVPLAIGERRKAAFEQCIATNELVSFEEEMTSPTQGGQHYLVRNYYPLREPDGSVERVLGFSYDLTAQKEIELALRESEARFHAIVEATPIPMVITRVRDGLILYANQQLGETFGLPEAQAVGRNAAEFYSHPEDRQRLLQELQAHDYVSNFEVEVKRQDGTPFWVVITVQKLLMQGEPTMLVGFYDITARKTAEEEVRRLNEELEQRVQTRTRDLQDSEERLRQIAENIDEVLWIESRADRSLLYVSPNYEKIWGRTPESLLERPELFMESVLPEDREAVRAHLQKQRRGEYSELEYRIIHPNGALRWVRDRSFPIQDQNGAIYRTAGMGEDVTARKQNETAEQARNERLQRHQAALLRLAQTDNSDLEAMRKNILEAAAQTLEVERVSYWSFIEAPRGILCEDLYLLTAQTHESGVRLLEQDYARYFEALGHNRTIAAHEAQSDPRTAGFTESYLKPLGITSMLDVPIWLHGQVVGIICHEHTGPARVWTRDEQEFAASMADLHTLALEAAERLRAEAALRQSEALKSAILNSALDAIITIDHESKILEFNRAAEKIFGYARAKVVGCSITELIIPPELRERHRKSLERYLVTGESKILGTHMELTALRSNGEAFPVELTINRIVAEQSPKFTAFVRDISQRKIMQEQLRQYTEELERLVTQRAERIQELERQRAETEKLAAAGRLAARIAHEINNPLGGIKNSFLLVKDAITPEHPYFHYVGRIEKEIDRIARIVRQMFQLNKPDQELSRPFKIEETIREIMLILEPSRREHSVQFEFDPGNRDLLVTMPEGLLRQILFNLIQNAIEASPPSGIVKVRVFLEKEKLHLAVADQGVGISAEIGPRIFEPFFTTKSGLLNTGLGLGLSVCKNIVDALRGTIVFENGAGKGTVFKVALPITTLARE